MRKAYFKIQMKSCFFFVNCIKIAFYNFIILKGLIMKIASLAISVLLATSSATSQTLVTHPSQNSAKEAAYFTAELSSAGLKKATLFNSNLTPVMAYSSQQSNFNLSAGSAPDAFTTSELVEGNFVLIDEGNDTYLPYFATALNFESNGTGIAGFNFSDSFYDEQFDWAITDNGNVKLTSKGREYTETSYPPFENIAELYGQDLADHLNAKYERREIDYIFQYQVYTEFDLTISKQGLANNYETVHLAGNDYNTLIIPEEWDWPESTLKSTVSFNKVNKLYDVKASAMLAAEKNHPQGKWAVPMPYSIKPTNEGDSDYFGTFAETVDLQANGAVSDETLSGIKYNSWAVDEGVITLVNDNAEYKITPFINIEKAYFTRVEEYKYNTLTRTYIGMMAKYDDTYTEYANNLDIPFPNFWALGTYLYTRSSNDAVINVDDLTGYKFFSDGRMWRYVTLQEGEVGNNNYEDWRYVVDERHVVTERDRGYSLRQRHWDTISVNDAGQAFVLQYSYIGYDTNDDGSVTDDELSPFVLPSIQIMIKTDLSTYERWESLPDSDSDGLKDIQEEELGTDIYNADSDFDGISDFDEFDNGLNPLDATDAAADADNDGVSNSDELLFGTDINNADTDGDGVSDGDEIQLGLNPLDPNDIANAPSNLIKFTDYNGDGVIDWLKHSVVGDAVWLTVLDGRDFSAFSFFNMSSKLENVSVEQLGDRNNDGIKEVGLFGFNADVGRYQLAVYNGYTGQSMGTWNWPETLQDVEFKLLEDLTLDGVQEYAITGIHLTNGTKQLFVKDGASKQTYQTFKWTNQWLDAQIVQMSDITNDGVPEVALYGRHERLDKGQLFVFDGTNSNNKLDVYNWNKLWNNLSLHEMDDLDGDGTIDWGQFGQRKDDGRYQWLVKKGHDKRGVIRTFSWPNDLTAAQPLLLSDRTGDDVKEVALYGKNGSGKLFLRVNDGRLANTRIANYSWPATWLEEQVMELGDLNNDGTNEVALLGINKNTGKYQLVVKDGQAGTEYGRLTFEGDWADLAISSYDASSDGHADIIVNGVDVGTLKRSSLIYSGDGLGLLSTTVH